MNQALTPSLHATCEPTLVMVVSALNSSLLPLAVPVGAGGGGFGRDELETAIDVATADTFPRPLADDTGTRQPEDELAVLVVHAVTIRGGERACSEPGKERPPGR